MKQFSIRGWSQVRIRGFTVIELLIATVVLAVLLAVAYPSYQSQVRKSRRAEAFTALSNIQQLQERIRSTRETYANSLTNATTATPPGLGMTTTNTSSGYYTLAVAHIGGGTTGFIASAQAVATTTQGADGSCAGLAVRVDGGNVRYGAGPTAATIDWTAADADPTRCWAR